MCGMGLCFYGSIVWSGGMVCSCGHGDWWKSCMDQLDMTIRSFSWLDEMLSAAWIFFTRHLLLCLVFCGISWCKS